MRPGCSMSCCCFPAHCWQVLHFCSSRTTDVPTGSCTLATCGSRQTEGPSSDIAVDTLKLCYSQASVKEAGRAAIHSLHPLQHLPHVYHTRAAASMLPWDCCSNA